MQKTMKAKMAAAALAAAMAVQSMAVPAMAAAPNVMAGGKAVIAEGKAGAEITGTASPKSAKKITPAIALSTTSYTYDGKEKKPAVTVKNGSKALSPSTYNVSYSSGRKNVGTYTVTVNMKGGYSGKATASYSIIPPCTTISSLTATQSKPSLKIAWKKQATQADGYQIQYAASSNFKTGAKSVTVKGTGNTSKTVTGGISAGKTYYVRIRTYKTVGKTNVCSLWSKASSASIKSGQQTVATGKYGFTKQTEAIVEKHMNDFTYKTFGSFMSSKGGAQKYVRSLGGVFAKWCGVRGNVRTAGQFQEVAEYVMGVMTIWGPDYCGGGGDHAFNGNWGEGSQYGRFYAGQKATHHWRCKPLESVYFHDKDHIMTDCGCGAAYIMNKAGLLADGKYAGITYKSQAWRKVDASRGGTVITRKEDLQVGDLLQMSKTTSESGWMHVCIVGEVRSDGTIITYDTGNRYVQNANYKKKLTINSNGTCGGDYKGYKSWFAVRFRSLDQSDAKISK